jgi:nucleoside-diphosphate kinase
MITPTREIVEEHYAEHRDKGYFNRLVNFVSSDIVVIMVLEGENVIAEWRRLMGTSRESISGTIRFDFAASVDKNVVHGSDNHIRAKRELGIWFE